MENSNLIFTFKKTDKPIKVVYENYINIQDSNNGSVKIERKAKPNDFEMIKKILNHSPIKNCKEVRVSYNPDGTYRIEYIDCEFSILDGVVEKGNIILHKVAFSEEDMQIQPMNIEVKPVLYDIFFPDDV